MDNINNLDDSEEKILRGIKYVRLNHQLEQKQYNRFQKLFGNGKECHALLILRILDAYTMFVSPNPNLYCMESLYNFVNNFIFDKEFWKNAVELLPYNTMEFDIEPTKAENDIEEIIKSESIEVINESNTENIEGCSNGSNNESNDELNAENIIYYSNNFNDNDKIVTQAQNSLLTFKNFFDSHFLRQGYTIYYSCNITYNENYRINCNELTELQTQKYDNSIFITITDYIYQFIDNIMSNIPMGVPFEKRYWTPNRRNLFYNYINNFGLFKIFQFKNYSKCNIRYSNFYGAGYIWDINSKTPMYSDGKDDIICQMGYIEGNNGVYHLTTDDPKYCINICFNKLKSKSSKPNKELIKAYLRYFTMNSTEVLDKLALDYANSILCWDFYHKNTLVSGDIDKIYKWDNLFGCMPIASTGTITFYLYLTNHNVPRNASPCLFCDLRNLPQKSPEEIIETFSLGTTSYRYNHRYFLIKHGADISKKYLELVNTIDFPYGGEFYELEPLTDVDRLEIVKLLIVHGWHLLNSDSVVKPDISGDKKDDVFFNNLIKIDETRIPLNILHQIYSRFINSGKNISELREKLQTKGFNYTTMDIRDKDKAYLRDLSNDAEKFFLTLEIRNTKKQKSVNCKLDPKFWSEISSKTKKENESRQSEEFDLYLKSLAEKYKPFYEVDIQEPEQDDPYKNWKTIDKIPDDDLQ